MKDENVIQVFNNNHPAYYRLLVAANIIQLFSDVYCMVEKTYFDFGQDWEWTTIIAHPDKKQGIQILSPKQQAKLITGDIDEFLDTCKTIAKHVKEAYSA